jgi:hypothetical protein
MRGVVGLTIALLALSSTALAAPERSFDYLYIRANEGQSSGGHAAIRFGAWVFDFQYDDGLVRLRREEWGPFQYVYRTLQNRGIELSRVAVNARTFELLDGHFQRQYLAQRRQWELLDSMRNDVRLIELWLAGERGESVFLDLPGAGFFPGPPESKQKEVSESTLLQRLRQRVIERHGRDFFSARRSALQRKLAALDISALDADAISLEPGRYPNAPAAFSERYADHLLAEAALERLEHPTTLATGTRVGERWLASDSTQPPPADLGALDADARARLRQASEALIGAMADLVDSPRRDWAHPLLLGMARLAVLEESLSSGRLVLLDAFSADAQRLEIRGRRRTLLPDMVEEAGAELEASRRAFFAGQGWREADYRALEEAASRWFELRAALAGASHVRLEGGLLMPEGPGPLALHARPRDPAARLEQRLAETRAALARYQEHLDKRYSYDLFQRNCVSEIFRTIDQALLTGAPRATVDAEHRDEFVRAASERRLGGYVDPVAGFNFIPRVSSRHVRTHYAVTNTVHLPSYRQHQMAQMAESEAALRVALRESNVLTSTLYEPDDQDGFFLFFTDGSVALRPLLGAVNLVAGIAKGGVGLLLLPFDGSRSLRSGFEGAFFSVPELFFQNVRKGTNEWVPDDEIPPG